MEWKKQEAVLALPGVDGLNEKMAVELLRRVWLAPVLSLFKLNIIFLPRHSCSLKKRVFTVGYPLFFSNLYLASIC
ncbi:hypothetical protein [Ferruginibacter sp.]